MRVRLLLVTAVAFALGAGTTASRANDSADCFPSSHGSDAYKDKDYIPHGLRACDNLISSGDHSGAALASILRARGYWKHKKGDYDGAIEDYNRAVALDPKHVEGYDYRADTYVAMGNLDRAIADYDMAIRQNPNYAAAYFSRGHLYEKKGLTDRARADYNAALAVPAQNHIDEWAHSAARARLEKLPK